MKNRIKRVVVTIFTLALLITCCEGINAIDKKGGYSQNDIRVISGLSEEKIREILPPKLKELSPTLYEIEHKPNPINAIFLLSVIRLETGNGTSYSYNVRNNVGGVMGNNGLRTFNSKEECLYYMQSFLNKGYISQGRISVWSIGSKYCVGGNWASKVNGMAIKSMYKSWRLK